MPDYSIYISPVKKTALLFLVLAFLILYFKPSYLISYAGITELDWSDINTYWILIGSMGGVFLLFNLIPGLYLGNEYYRYDKLAYNKIKNYPLQEFKKSIQKVDCINSYSDGTWAPGAIHADYWYYNIYLEHEEEEIKASHFLTAGLDLFEYLDHEPYHVYSAFPTMKWEDDVIPKDKDYLSFGPSEALIERFENRYKNYSREKLKSIIYNDSFRREAKIAAQNLLTNKQK